MGWDGNNATFSVVAFWVSILSVVSIYLHGDTAIFSVLPSEFDNRSCVSFCIVEMKRNGTLKGGVTKAEERKKRL